MRTGTPQRRRTRGRQIVARRRHRAPPRSPAGPARRRPWPWPGARSASRLTRADSHACLVQAGRSRRARAPSPHSTFSLNRSSGARASRSKTTRRIELEPISRSPARRCRTRRLADGARDRQVPLAIGQRARALRAEGTARFLVSHVAHAFLKSSWRRFPRFLERAAAAGQAGVGHEISMGAEGSGPGGERGVAAVGAQAPSSARCP